MKIIEDNPVLAGGVLLAAIGALWLATRGATQTGKDLGGGAVNLVFGGVSGATSALVTNANDPNANPLYDFGSWIGGKVYSASH